MMSVNSVLRRSRGIFNAARSIIIRSQTTVSEDKTHFGYQDVTKEEKAYNVHEVFTSVADRYDLMNDLMSGGIHRLWKDDFVKTLSPVPGMKILDVAGGTGDISFRILKHLDQFDGQITNDTVGAELRRMDVSTEEEERPHFKEPKTDVVVCDFNSDMLRVGELRAKELKLDHRLSWVEGDAMNLPFKEETFDAYTIAFGIRNVVSVEKAVEEAYRVLKRGGRFMCLEFSYVENPLVRWAYDQFSFQIIPVMGQVVAGDWKSYQYLVESIRRFPNQETFLQIIRDAGFRLVSYRNYTFGVCAVHTGFKV